MAVADQGAGQLEQAEVEIGATPVAGAVPLAGVQQAGDLVSAERGHVALPRDRTALAASKATHLSGGRRRVAHIRSYPPVESRRFCSDVPAR